SGSGLRLQSIQPWLLRPSKIVRATIAGSGTGGSGFGGAGGAGGSGNRAARGGRWGGRPGGRGGGSLGFGPRSRPAPPRLPAPHEGDPQHGEHPERQDQAAAPPSAGRFRPSRQRAIRRGRARLDSPLEGGQRWRRQRDL